MKIDDQGLRNQVAVPPDTVGAADLTIRGNDNRISVASGCRFPRAQLEIRGDHCEIHIGAACVLTGEFRCRESHTRLHIGSRTTSMGLKITMHESGEITIGEDCMFSGDVRMDTSDMHSIIDLVTRRRVNPPADIRIGDHVWVGYGVYLMKGVQIGPGSIVGATSVVTHDIPAHCVAAGSPARVLREGVTWDRARLPLDQALPGIRRWD